MLTENIMNGRLPTANDAPCLGAGIGKERMKEVLTPSSTDLTVNELSFEEHCVLNWDGLKEADRYRVDIYRITDLGPSMGCLNYVAIQSEYVTDTSFKTCRLEKMTTYQAIVFAFKGDECIARYVPVFCVVTPKTVGDMLSDETEDFLPAYKSTDNDFFLEYKALCAEKSVLLNKNPDRGFRAEEDYFLPAEEDIPDWSEDSVLAEVKSRVEKNTAGETVTVSRVYMILNKYVNYRTLPEKLLDYMEAIWNAYRTLGIKMYLCHYYQHGHTADCVTLETVTEHLKQLAPRFERNVDILYAMNFSFIGCYGEWTCIRIPLDRQKFVNTFMDAAPDDVRLIIRHPMFKHWFINKEFWRYNRIGFADDACHGLMFPHIDLGQNLWQPGSQWWEMSVKESPYTLNDSETFTTRWIRLSGSWPKGVSCMQSLSQKHITTLSIQHAYGDTWQFGGSVGQTCMHGWKSEEITEEQLSKLGLTCSDGWFKDVKGNCVKRNAFEYLRDHIGYRFGAQNLKVHKTDNGIFVTLSLKNYGYGAGFNLKSCFVITDDKNREAARVDSGNPEEWYGTNPENYGDRELLVHTISANMPLPKETGDYSLALRIENSLGQTARLDNELPYKNGNNILFSFNID